MKKYIQLQDSFDSKKGDIWEQITIYGYTNKLSKIFIENTTIEKNPDWFAPYEEKLDLRSPESEKMREEARSKRWGFVPNDSDRYYYHDLYRKTVTYNFWNCNGDNVDYSLWNMGNCHRTEEEALAWGEKYARYFLTESEMTINYYARVVEKRVAVAP